MEPTLWRCRRHGRRLRRQHHQRKLCSCNHCPRSAGGDGSVSTIHTIPTYPITTSLSPSGGGTWGICSSTVAHGNTATCFVIANPGYTLIQITGCGGMHGSTRTLTNVQGTRP